ncbi:class A beta-lactamase [Dyella sp. ASV21]|uniref:class A beta-lactamase n=1 Tax=Dyella sp. ASV21 TaxID=2795114 RepID=UPI0018EB99B0|nr:class A beta-lactamase [Dyella sp. ASV21]
MMDRMFGSPLRAAALIVACATTALWTPLVAQAATTPQQTQWQQAVDAAVQRARPGVLGVAVLDVRTGAQAGANAAQPFPMMSVFKAPVAAAVLARVDAGRLTLDHPVIITRSEVLSGSAVPSIGAKFHGERMSFTVERLLQAAVSESDNTAVDALIKLLGGPQEVTAFLRAHGIDGMRVDQDEAGVSRVFQALEPGQSLPANESAEAEVARYRRGYQAFLADPRNRTTPQAAVDFLRKLQARELLSDASTGHLLALMRAQVIPNRLRAGAPAGVVVADKTGTSGSFEKRTAAYNDMALLTWPDGRTVIVAAFLSDSPATPAERDALFADLARTLAASVQP